MQFQWCPIEEFIRSGKGNICTLSVEGNYFWKIMIFMIAVCIACLITAKEVTEVVLFRERKWGSIISNVGDTFQAEHVEDSAQQKDNEQDLVKRWNDFWLHFGNDKLNWYELHTYIKPSVVPEVHNEGAWFSPLWKSWTQRGYNINEVSLCATKVPLDECNL